MTEQPRGVPRRGGRTLSLAAVLALSFGLVVVAGVAAVLVISLTASGANTVGLLNDKSTLMVRLIETGVRNHLDPALDQAEFVERQVRFGVVDLDNADSLGDVLLGALAAAPQIVAVVFWDMERNLTVARLLEDRRATVEYADDSDDRLIQDLQRRAAASPEAFWGDLIFEPTLQVTIVNLIQPLRIDNEMKGMLGIALTMPGLSDLISEIGDQFDATAFILYGEDQVLAHPNLTSRHAELSQGNPTVGLDRVGDLVLAGLPSAEPSPLQDGAAAIDVGLINVAGTDYIAFTGVIGDYGAVPWRVGVHLPRDRVDAEIIRLAISAVAGGVVLVLSVIAAIVMGRVLARPIRRMAGGAVQVGSLELEAVAPLPPSRIRELDDQAQAFNRMLAALKWFETYVPRSLVKRLVASGEDHALASGERTLTILFSDIVGFTAMSETMAATDVATLLNDHFALLGGCVDAEGGTIDKFIGDGLMAFWGAPDDQDDHGARACRAAQAIATAVGTENGRRKQQGLAPIRVRLGVHTGPVVVGNIGAPGRINYTIVGDAVNTAQRLESLGRELDRGDDVTVIISAATAAAVSMEGFGIESAGVFGVKGKAVPLEVFRLGHGTGAEAP